MAEARIRSPEVTGRRITLPEYLEIWRQMLGFPFYFNLKG